MHQFKRVLCFALVLTMMFGITAFASEHLLEGSKSVPAAPTLTAFGNTAKCKATIIDSGSYINATLELYQGSTLVDSWQKTGTGVVSFSEEAPIVRGLPYTLTLSGTINGVEFTPVSVTKTL